MLHQTDSEEPVRLTIVLPCLNEVENLPIALSYAKELAGAVPYPVEILVSDNGSTDGSVELASELGATVLHCPKKGYGFALIHGIEQAKGEWILMGDADGTYDFREAAALLKNLEEGRDFAMGSRLKGNIEPGAMPGLHRWLGTPVLTFLIRRFFGLNISDCNCGMRAFTKEAYQKMRLVSGGMEFASEMLIKAAMLKLDVSETPISLKVSQKNRAPHLNTWRDGWRHLRFILLFAPHVVFQIPGWILLGLGLLLSLPVLGGPLTLGGRVFDFHYLFFGLPLFHIGYQALWLAHLDALFLEFSGLAPSTRPPPRVRSIEFWLALGGTAILIGAVCLLSIVAIWIRSGFDALNQIRLGIIGVSLLYFGAQSIMNAFFSGMLTLKISHRSPPPK